jgi:UDP-2,3-diacylglucosamine pyrophosphatase LpxH
MLIAPSYTVDALYVVSDLHIGNSPERSMFQDEERLAEFIDYVTTQRPGDCVALCLNGDIVDFLAARDARLFDPLGAAKKLTAIVNDFPKVFEALRRFTSTNKRRLVIATGNHDIELALPHVIEHFLKTICENDEARGRVRLCVDGTGFLCSIGGRSVLVVHGNHTDGWNVVDHERIRETAAALHAGKSLPTWHSNAGTTLVIDVINRVKTNHPWIELLKPEDINLVALLVAMDRSVLALIPKAPGIAMKFAKGIISQRFLGSLESTSNITSDDVPGTSTPPMSPDDERALIAEALMQVDDPNGRVVESNLESLSFVSALVKPDITRIREAIQEWQAKAKDSFAVSATSGDDTAMINDVEPSVDVLITGHTHAARAQPRGKNMAGEKNVPWYFNSGTWIAMFDLPPAFLSDNQAFEPMWQALRGENKTPRVLLEEQPAIIRRAATAVRVHIDGDTVHGSLLRFPGRGNAPVEETTGRCTFNRIPT